MRIDHAPSPTTIPLIPREILFGNPEKASPQISPDGKYLAYIAPDAKDVQQVWVRTIGKDDDRKGSSEHERFDFLGYTFRPRRSKNRLGKYFINFAPAVLYRISA